MWGNTIRAQPKTKVDELLQQVISLVDGDSHANELEFAKITRTVKQLPDEVLDKRFMLEVMLHCAKGQIDQAEAKLFKLIDTVYWEPSSIVNGCEALASVGYFERAYDACMRALELSSNSTDVLMYAMRFSLGVGKLDKFEEIYHRNQNLLDKTENSQIKFTVNQLLQEHEQLEEALKVSGTSLKDYQRLLKLSEDVARTNSVRTKFTSQFNDPEENDLFINIFVGTCDEWVITKMNDEVIESIIESFNDLPNSSVQYLPATESLIHPVA